MPERRRGSFESEHRNINGITAKCRACGWQKTGQITIDIIYESILESPLIESCRQHHIDENDRILHNRFDLLKGHENVGFASVSSECSIGTLVLKRSPNLQKIDELR